MKQHLPRVRSSSRPTGGWRGSSSRSTTETNSPPDATAWPGARALPWDAWLQKLWQDALAAGVCTGDARLRTPLHAATRWNRIVAAQATPLIDARGAALIAPDAWTLVHAWGAGGESWRAWGGNGGGRRRLRDLRPLGRPLRGASSGCQGDRQRGVSRSARAWAARVPRGATRRSSLAGFVEFSPQQVRLIAALGGRGARSSAWTRCRSARAHPRAPRARRRVTKLCVRCRGRATRALADPGAAIGDRRSGSRLAARRSSRARRRHPVSGVAVARPRRRCRVRTICRSAARSPTCRSSPPHSICSTGRECAVAARACRGAVAFACIAAGRRCVDASSRYSRPIGCEGRPRDDHDARGDRRSLAASTRRSPQRWAAAHRAACDGPQADRRASMPKLGGHGSRPRMARSAGRSPAPNIRRAAHGTMRSRSLQRLARSSGACHAPMRSPRCARTFEPKSSSPSHRRRRSRSSACSKPPDSRSTRCGSPGSRPSDGRRRRGRIRLLPLSWQRERNVPRASAARELAYATALTAQFACAAPKSCSRTRRTPTIIRARRRRCCPPTRTSVAARSDRQSPFRRRIGNSRVERRANPWPTMRAPALAAGSRARRRAAHRSAERLSVQGRWRASAGRRNMADAGRRPVAIERGVLVHAALAAFWRACEDARTLVGAVAGGTAFARSCASGERRATSCLPASAGARCRRWCGKGSPRASKLVASMDRRIRALAAPVHADEVEAGLTLALPGVFCGCASIASTRWPAAALRSSITRRVDRRGRIAWFDPRPPAPQLGLYALAQRAPRSRATCARLRTRN